MRTILAILAALAIATAAHAETEALVTDTNNNVISQRTGTLALTNSLLLNGLSFRANDIEADASLRISELEGNNPSVAVVDDSGYFTSAAIFTNIAPLRDSLGLGVGDAPKFLELQLGERLGGFDKMYFLSVEGPTLEWYYELLDSGTNAYSGRIDFVDGGRIVVDGSIMFASNSQAAATRTNLGLGTTNAPTFADLTLTTLTNATGPNLVLADTNGTLTTGSVPSGAAPLGAVQTADGAGGSSFVASRADSRSATSSVTRSSWTTNFFNQAGNYDSGLGQWTLDANSTYKVEYALQFTIGATNSGFAQGFLLSGALHTNGVTTQRLGTSISGLGSALFIVIYTAGETAIPLDGMGAATGYRYSVGSFIFRTPTNSITLAYHWCPTQNVTNTLTREAGSTISVTKIAP
jgi:hypothetical protein